MKNGIMELGRADLDEHVACGSCTVCCHQAVMLMGWEDHRQYETIRVDQLNIVDGSSPTYWLKRNPDGSCIYLKDGGCSIYDRRPKVCRAFSCVGWVAKIKREHTRPEWRRMVRRGDVDRDIWREGVKRS